MRIAGGVLVLLIGILSLVEGGCIAVGCHAASKISQAMGTAGLEAAGALGGKATTPEEAKKLLAGAAAQLADAEKLAKSANTIGNISLVIRLAGLLCIVAGILFFVNKGKIFGFIAPGVGILAEIALIAVMAFTTMGLVKILVYAFGIFAATKIGEQKAAA